MAYYLNTCCFSQSQSQAEPGILVSGLLSPTRQYARGFTSQTHNSKFIELAPVIVQVLHGEGVNVTIIYLALARLAPDQSNGDYNNK